MKYRFLTLSLSVLTMVGFVVTGRAQDQGEYWRFDPRALRTEKVTLYRFE